MNIVKYIIELLNENGKIAVPGLGSFIIEYKATTIHPVEHTFTPPARSIVFSTNIPEDDLLVRTISEQENISISDSLNSIRKFSDGLLSDIQKGKLAGIEGLGVFSLNDENHIAFVPETNGFSDDEFGLSGFTSPAIVRSEFKDKAAHNAQVAKEVKIKKSKRRKRNFALLTTVVVVTGLIYLVIFTDIFRNFIYNNGANSEPKTEQSAIVNETPAPVQITETDSVAAKDTLSDNVSTTIPAEAKETVSNAVVDENSQVKQYYLVAGSFKSEENANKSVSALKAKGYTNAGMFRQYKDNGMFIVYYESHLTNEEAVIALKQIIKTENHDSWLLKK